MEAQINIDELSPRAIVLELDKYIVGQKDAKLGLFDILEKLFYKGPKKGKATLQETGGDSFGRVYDLVDTGSIP